jgi:CDGSH-type Zn-finger protein
MDALASLLRCRCGHSLGHHDADGCHAGAGWNGDPCRCREHRDAVRDQEIARARAHWPAPTVQRFPPPPRHR